MMSPRMRPLARGSAKFWAVLYFFGTFSFCLRLMDVNKRKGRVLPMKMMKKMTALLLALMMVLSLAACGGKNDNGGSDSKKDDPAADMTAQQVLDALQETLGDSYGCDMAEDEDRMTNYYGLDLSQIDSWAAASSESSAIDSSTAVVLKVKDGYAQDAAALLQERYDQMLDYSKMYSMNLPMVQQARLFINGNYVALLILGQTPDDTADEAKLAQDEAAKVDAAWQSLFGSASNQLVVK